ncbi:hypothetical protein RRG08_024024 [Elysia crispata]|uniref:Uncharacterized protein n=1 Tax=Elysia crispata TaxID=231223 RepID=A0AAE0Z6V5_9GAST|nr:hypothetical protein RRG08_024024 [Elysia crispata]
MGLWNYIRLYRRWGSGTTLDSIEDSIEDGALELHLTLYKMGLCNYIRLYRRWGSVTTLDSTEDGAL